MNGSDGMDPVENDHGEICGYVMWSGRYTDSQRLMTWFSGHLLDGRLVAQCQTRTEAEMAVCAHAKHGEWIARRRDGRRDIGSCRMRVLQKR